ncbi:MAG TPA: transporter substrate-binding domain-containing protein [Actinomycetota bacterium]|nr:transporter substrate-binding domain-containing protein [Actinomycetota bacterium]
MDPLRARAALLSALLIAGLLVGCNRADREAGGVGCRGSRLELIRPQTLLVGADVGIEPFAFRREGELTGFEVELMRELGRRMNLEVEIVNRTAPGLLPGLIAKRYDAVAAAVRTSAENRAQVCFSAPYLEADLAVVSTRAFEDLSAVPDGTRVAVEAGSVASAWTGRNLDRRLDADVVPTLQDVLRAVDEGGVAVMDLANARARAKDTRLRIVEVIDTGEDHAVAFHPDGGALRDRISQRIEAMREDGSLEALEKEWFGERPG